MVKSLQTDQQIVLKTPSATNPAAAATAFNSPTASKPGFAGFNVSKDREVITAGQGAPTPATTPVALLSRGVSVLPGILVTPGAVLRSSAAVGVLVAATSSVGPGARGNEGSEGKSPTAALKSTAKPQIKLH